MKLNLQLGDRIEIMNTEFSTWKPTCATVVKLYLQFPFAEPSIKRKIVGVILDNHPFPEQLWFDPMSKLEFDINDPNFKIKKLSKEQ